MTEANVSTARSEARTVPEDWQPHIVALVCNWCSYAGADMAGTTRIEYPASVRMVRFPTEYSSPAAIPEIVTTSREIWSRDDGSPSSDP
jgi:hypothetical protein